MQSQKIHVPALESPECGHNIQKTKATPLIGTEIKKVADGYMLKNGDDYELYLTWEEVEKELELRAE